AARFRALSAPVGHVKLLASSSAGYAVANLTGGEPSVRGDAGATDAAMLTVNARVELPPEQLRAEALAALRRACGAAIEHRVDALVSLTPGRPNPTYRYDRAID
ncbi:MAG: cobalamin synthesis protein P47K, partial [Clostridiales bacterium]|nr:cobalamin synthesis protein P47K [Clostridiales bacterium]